jgi:hypothetical protein
MKYLISILFSIHFFGNTIAQNVASDSSNIIPFQFSFFPPLSTNGYLNQNSVNNISINLIAGYSGGLEGFEAGGFANVIKNDMNGIQMAGFANVVASRAKGSMFSGFTNIVGKDFKGLQMAGFTNVVNDSLEGAQFAGFCNINGNKGKGLQSAGFLNVNNGSFQGYQASGFSNTVNGEFKGLQLAGFNNTVKGNSESMQIAGFSNVNSGDFKGMQWAGFANINSGNVSGFQLSSFINVAKELNGVQLGFINYCDSVKSGTPFGFLSIVKHGYHKFEVYSNETFYGGFQFKTGTNTFYNILSIAARPEREIFYWSWGYGIGTEMKLSNRSRLNLDLTAHHINEGSSWTNHVNLLNKFNLNYGYEFAKHLTLYGGPTFNVLVVNKNTNTDFSNDQTIAPTWSFYDEMHQNTRIIMFTGFQVGLRF